MRKFKIQPPHQSTNLADEINSSVFYRETHNNPHSNITFKDLAITWYRDLFINHETADDETGVTNGIFEAFGKRRNTQKQNSLNQRENSLVINKGVDPLISPWYLEMKM